MTSDDVLPGLREALVEAGSRENRRRNSRRAMVRRIASTTVVVVLAFVGATIYALNDESPVGADVLVTRADDNWRIQVTSRSVTAKRIEDRLRTKGIDAAVDTLAVGPSRVGQFLSGDSNVALVGTDALSSTTVEIPVDAPIVRISFGRPANDGERYEAFSDAFAIGEPLACTGLRGSSAVAAMDQIVQIIDDVATYDSSGIAIERVQAHHVIESVVMLSSSEARVTVGAEAAQSDGRRGNLAECHGR